MNKFKRNLPRPDLVKDEQALRLGNMIFGEVGGVKGEDAARMVGSTAINRLDSKRDKEFGIDMDEVLQKGYYAVKDKDPLNKNPWLRATTTNLSGMEANKYSKVLDVAHNLFNRIEKPSTSAEFYFKENEAKSLKKKLRKVGSEGEYGLYSY